MSLSTASESEDHAPRYTPRSTNMQNVTQWLATSKQHPEGMGL